MDEVDAIASEPTCVHRFLLHDFQEVESLKYAIEKSTCEGTSRCHVTRYVMSPRLSFNAQFFRVHPFSTYTESGRVVRSVCSDSF